MTSPVKSGEHLPTTNHQDDAEKFMAEVRSKRLSILDQMDLDQMESEVDVDQLESETPKPGLLHDAQKLLQVIIPSILSTVSGFLSRNEHKKNPYDLNDPNNTHDKGFIKNSFEAIKNWLFPSKLPFTD